MAKINNNYSPNFSVPKRIKKNIKYIILHYTGMINELSAIRKLCDFKSEVSAHYFIKENGQIINLIPDLYIAWHAGKSKWKKTSFLNKLSIGIEIQNPGHDYGYKRFSSKQMKSIKKLLKKLIKKYRIDISNILGHSDIAPDRKKDPGEKFPWKNLAKYNLAKWHNLDEKIIKTLRKKKLSKKDDKIFLQNLYLIGYNKSMQIKAHLSKKLLITAFQRRFRQNLINGKSDKECLLISKNLLKY